MSNDEILKDIKSGKGLKPLPTQSTDSEGVSKEQRNLSPGRSSEIFSLDENKKGD